MKVCRGRGGFTEVTQRRVYRGRGGFVEVILRPIECPNRSVIYVFLNNFDLEL